MIWRTIYLLFYLVHQGILTQPCFGLDNSHGNSTQSGQIEAALIDMELPLRELRDAKHAKRIDEWQQRTSICTYILSNEDYRMSPSSRAKGIAKRIKGYLAPFMKNKDTTSIYEPLIKLCEEVHTLTLTLRRESQCTHHFNIALEG
ncbi:hypothetical protein B0J14DRAFT_108682 [Halenospora varia]|nr:hypothetical protein B0J14DRAFT_108682 [Halenospora varia]